LSISQLNGSGNLYLGGTSGTALTITGGGNFSGNISDSGYFTPSSVTVSGGTLTLSGNNTYNGGTTISAGGTLLANSAPSSSSTGSGTVAVNALGVLGGTGTIANNTGSPVTIYSGGTISPGPAAANGSVGTLTSGDQTWNGGGQYTWKLNAAAPPTQSAGDTSDLIVVNGTLNIAATPINPFLLYVERVDTNLEGITTGTYVLATATNVAGDFTDPTPGNAIDLTSYFSVSDSYFADVSWNAVELINTGSGYDLDLTTGPAPTPEPGAVGLLGIASVGLLRRRRQIQTGIREQFAVETAILLRQK
jgi:MYXO-CTERM domain-containing protein